MTTRTQKHRPPGAERKPALYEGRADRMVKAKARGKVAAMLSRYRKVVDLHLSNGNLTLREIADEAGISTAMVQKVLTAHYAEQERRAAA